MNIEERDLIVFHLDRINRILRNEGYKYLGLRTKLEEFKEQLIKEYRDNQ